jgi:hypothetical protein
MPSSFAQNCMRPTLRLVIDMNQDLVLDAMEPNHEYTKLKLTRHVYDDDTITSLDTRYLAVSKIITRLCKYKSIVRIYKNKTPYYIKKINEVII